MSVYGLDTRRLLARERVEQLERDAQERPARRRRTRVRRLLQSEMPLLSAARRRAASLRLSS